MDSDYNYLFKVVLIGDSGVGKSNLMTRYTADEFSETSPSTIGVEFMTKGLKIDNRDVKVQIWDTAGQERFRAISRSIYHGAKGAMVVYDITNQQSFDHVPTWLTELKSHVHSSTAIMLIGNKCDLDHLRAVKRETADKFARENGLSFLETSALDSTNVGQAYDWLVREIYQVVTTGGISGGTGPGGNTPAGKTSKPTVTGGQTVTLTNTAGDAPRPAEPKKKGCCGK